MTQSVKSQLLFRIICHISMVDNRVTVHLQLVCVCVCVCVSNQQMVKADGLTANNHIAGAQCHECLNSHSSLQLPLAFKKITVHTQIGFMSGLKQTHFSRTGSRSLCRSEIRYLTFFFLIKKNKKQKDEISCLNLCPFRVISFLTLTLKP